MARAPQGQGTDEDFSPAAVATQLEQLADALSQRLRSAVEGEAKQELEECLVSLRHLCTAARALSLLFDATRASAVARREEELQDILSDVGASVRDLAGANQRAARSVGAQLQELDSLAALPPGEDLAKRLRSTMDKVRQASGQIYERLVRMSAEVRAATERIGTLEKELKEAREKARYDSLTKVYSRAALDEALEEAVVSSGTNGPWCFLLADIDHFKAVNDRYGHVVGDALLFKVARLIEGSLGKHAPGAVLGRYGGEEFGILVPNSRLPRAKAIADQMRQTVAASRWQYGDHPERPVVQATISIGVAQHRPEETTAQLVHRADRAMYEAKRQGRNRVCTAQA